jgi:hypothetical protein
VAVGWCAVVFGMSRTLHYAVLLCLHRNGGLAL